MRFDVPLDDMLASRSHVRILRVLASVSRDDNLSGRDLARRAGVSHPRTSQVLAELSREGAVTARRHPNYGLYELNVDHVLGGVLRRLFDAEAEVAEDLLAVLGGGVARAGRHVRAAVLCDRDEPRLDLVVLTAVGREVEVDLALDQLVEEVRRRYGNDLRCLVVARRRALDRVRRGDPRWVRIAREGIPVLRTFPRVR